jgi:prepilin-type N-terminal cleavage/methylation domain-containing protein
MAVRSRFQDGFTLTELSIVLAIIGVIAGGILAGETILEAAKIRSVVTDVNKFRTVVETFKQQYGGYPGDLRNAFQFFGADCGGDSAAPTGCNGNGNDVIEGEDEGYRAWQHLALSGVLSNVFTGQVGAGCTPSVNVAEARIGVNAGYGFEQNLASAYQINRPAFVNLMFLGSNNNNLCTGPAITIDQAYQIDLKMDDENPSDGEVVAVGASCVNSGEFNFGTAGNVCAMAFTLN